MTHRGAARGRWLLPVAAAWLSVWRHALLPPAPAIGCALPNSTLPVVTPVLLSAHLADQPFPARHPR